MWTNPRTRVAPSATHTIVLHHTSREGSECGATLSPMNRGDSIARARRNGTLYEVPNRDVLDDEKNHRADVVMIGGKVVKNRWGTIDDDRPN